MPYGTVQLRGDFHLSVGYDPVFHEFFVDVYRGDEFEPIGGLGGWRGNQKFFHEDDLIDAIPQFLKEKGIRKLTKAQYSELCKQAIFAKGGAEATIIRALDAADARPRRRWWRRSRS